jgi:serine/threonine-protein kinase
MFNPRIPPALEALVLRALSKDAADRPATAQEFARLLGGWRDLGEQDTVVRPVAPRPAPQRAPVASPRGEAALPRPAPRPATTSATNRMNLPSPRPPLTAQASPESRGLGFGGFFLALLLLAGVLGLVYLGVTGFFSDLFAFGSGAVAPSSAIVEQSTAEPTLGPSAVPLVLMPDLLNKTSQEAFAAVQAAGLTPLEDQPRYSDTISGGLVLDQFPLPNTEITQTTTVTYVVSLGPEPVEIPDVVGLRASNAQAALERAGFQVQLQEEASGKMPEGFVIRSDPRPPAKPPRGDTITLFVSIGDKVRMPDVTGLSEEQAKQQISAAGLVWSFSDLQGRDKLGDQFDRVAPGTVVSSEPRGGDLVPRGTGVTLGVRAP